MRLSDLVLFTHYSWMCPCTSVPVLSLISLLCVTSSFFICIPLSLMQNAAIGVESSCCFLSAGSICLASSGESFHLFCSATSTYKYKDHFGCNQYLPSLAPIIFGISDNHCFKSQPYKVFQGINSFKEPNVSQLSYSKHRKSPEVPITAYFSTLPQLCRSHPRSTKAICLEIHFITVYDDLDLILGFPFHTRIYLPT